MLTTRMAVGKLGHKRRHDDRRDSGCASFFDARMQHTPSLRQPSASSVKMDATQSHATRRTRAPVGQMTLARRNQRV